MEQFSREVAVTFEVPKTRIKRGIVFSIDGLIGIFHFNSNSRFYIPIGESMGDILPVLLSHSKFKCNNNDS